jgi:hypothetical protein
MGGPPPQGMMKGHQNPHGQQGPQGQGFHPN